MARASEAGWKVERHGGGRKHGWREAFVGNEKPARNQVFHLTTGMSQGGVRLFNAAGELVQAYWRQHKPGAVVLPIRFCIGCGCDDAHACTDGIDEGTPCFWIEEDKKTATGVCSECRRALTRWRKGDRKIRRDRR